MINLDKVNLLECVAGDIDLGQKLKYQVRITNLTKTPSEGEKSLKFVVGFDMLSGIENPAVTFRCTFEAEYRCEEGDDMVVLKEHVVVAHLVPFLREFVWNVTSRMPIGGLMIPPMQTHRMVELYNKRKSEESAPASAAPVV